MKRRPVTYTINQTSRDLDIPMFGAEFTTFADAVSAFAERFAPDRWVLDFERKMVIAFEVGTPGNRHAGIVWCVCPVK